MLVNIVSYIRKIGINHIKKQPSRLLPIFLLIMVGHDVFCQQKTISSSDIEHYIDDYAKRISTAEQSVLDWRTEILGKPTLESLPAYKLIHDRYLGTPFPDRKFVTIDGETIAPLKGRVTIINFWFLSCISCMAEMEGFNKLAELFSGQDVDILTITFDDPTAIRKELLSGRKMAFKIISISKTEIESIAKMKGYPTTLILDKKGYIRYWNTGNYPEAGKAVIHLLWNVGTKTAELLSDKTIAN